MGAGDLSSCALTGSAELFLQAGLPPSVIGRSYTEAFPPVSSNLGMLTSVDLQTLEASAHPSVGWRDDSWNASDPPQTAVDGQGLNLLLLSVHHRKTMKIETFGARTRWY